MNWDSFPEAADGDIKRDAFALMLAGCEQDNWRLGELIEPYQGTDPQARNRMMNLVAYLVSLAVFGTAQVVKDGGYQLSSDNAADRREGADIFRALVRGDEPQGGRSA